MRYENAQFYTDKIQYPEKYSRGWRGAPAKGVGRATGARVQIPLSPFSFLKKTYWIYCLKNFKKGVDTEWKLWYDIQAAENERRFQKKKLKK